MGTSYLDPLSTSDETLIAFNNKEVSEKNSLCIKTIGFLKRLPIVSQLISLIHFTRGNTADACETQTMFAQNLIDLLKSAPVNITKSFRDTDHTDSSQKITLVDRSINDDGDAKMVDTNRWMESLASDSKLSDLCLAGTHHSACYKAPTKPVACGSCWVTCQRWNIAAQLQAGIRFLDFRYQSPTHFGHGPATFAPVYHVAQDILQFAKQHPGEIIVCSTRINGNYEPNDCLHLSKATHNLNDIDNANICFEQISHQSNHDPVKMFHETLEQCSNINKANVQAQGNHNEDEHDLTPQIVIVENLDTHMFYYNQCTVKQLTNNSKQGLILIYDWDLWHGSWSFTKHNKPKIVLEKCLEWARHNPTTLNPRILEYVVTIDHGNLLTTVKLGLFESIQTASLSLGTISESLVDTENLSNLDAIFMDFPSQHILNLMIRWNLVRCSTVMNMD